VSWTHRNRRWRALARPRYLPRPTLANRKARCKARRVRSNGDTKESATPDIEIVRTAEVEECIETFPWHSLRFHVVTRDPLTGDQVKTLRRAISKVNRVGVFAELVATVLGRHVQIRTVRPSPDIRFEVGL
jgi:hypothetical protein